MFDHLLIVHKQAETLKKQACIDFLTGIYNSRKFNSLYNGRLNRLEKENQTFSVLMIDIDFFKKINDTYGHLAGDKVLKNLGCILNMFSRKSGIIGRVGGEEFCILLEGYNKDKVFEYGENLRRYIENSIFFISSTQQIHITVSIGISTYKETDSDIDNMREFADQKLYQAKESGRNKVCS